MGRERKNEGKGEGGTVWTTDRPCSKIFSVEIEIIPCVPRACNVARLVNERKLKCLKYA
jgi:hypothetical protein